MLLREITFSKLLFAITQGQMCETDHRGGAVKNPAINCSTPRVLCQLSASGSHGVTPLYFPEENGSPGDLGGPSPAPVTAAHLQHRTVPLSPRSGCSPALAGYRLEGCRTLCHRSGHQKPQSGVRCQPRLPNLC